ncbi:hypothetical protein F53441_6840 [Fusarium austroafricanum]|uniref:Uncharacterized protein n=1 Tax=Fusarium austroafricanum TaxID=2364996 RepID=A0A8H4KHJ6_9HYPO|nr:hypothetical protein F53441_6840 [Fusarium austroafricanum]
MAPKSSSYRTPESTKATLQPTRHGTSRHTIPNGPTLGILDTTQKELISQVDIETDFEADLKITDGLEEDYLQESCAIDLITDLIDPHLAGHVASTSRNVARFQKRMLDAVTELVDYPRQVPYPSYKKLCRGDRAMSTGFYTIFNTSSACSITNFLLRAIPPQVQTAIGKTRPNLKTLSLCQNHLLEIGHAGLCILTVQYDGKWRTTLMIPSYGARQITLFVVESMSVLQLITEAEGFVWIDTLVRLRQKLAGKADIFITKNCAKKEPMKTCAFWLSSIAILATNPMCLCWKVSLWP